MDLILEKVPYTGEHRLKPMRPYPHANRHDFLRLIDEPVPDVAVARENLIVGYGRNKRVMSVGTSRFLVVRRRARATMSRAWAFGATCDETRRHAVARPGCCGVAARGGADAVRRADGTEDVD